MTKQISIQLQAFSSMPVILIIILLDFSVLVRGFPEEAPPETCYFKGPNHPATKSQPLDTFPYEFVAEKGSYKPKEEITGKKLRTSVGRNCG